MSKITVLDEMSRIQKKIMHQHQLVNGKEAEAIRESLKKHIREYIDLVATAIEAKSIGSDPFNVVYGTGFEPGSFGDIYSNEYLNQQRAAGKINPAISGEAIKVNIAENKSFVMKFHEGYGLAYDHLKKRMVMIADGAVYVFAWGRKKLNEFVEWIMVKYQAMMQKLKEWRTSHAGTITANAGTEPTPAPA